MTRSLRYSWSAGDINRVFDFAFVEGTHGHPYAFGGEIDSQPVEIQDFFIATVPVTQALWTHVLSAEANPSAHQGPDLPIENVSWNDITRDGGFLDRINRSPIHASATTHFPARGGTFRLPSETEWE